MSSRGVVVAVVALLVAACGNGAADTGPIPADDAAMTEPVVLSPSSGVERAEPNADAPVGALAEGLNNAGFDLWRTQPIEGNLVFSPASIGHALLMARGAADEPTGLAIDTAFGLPAGMAAHEAWNALDQTIAAAADAEDEITITIADRVWPSIGAQPDQAWIDLLATEHGATSEALDFIGAPEASRDIINQWVAEQTRGLITEIVPEGPIDPNTVLMLTDAIYFKAQWQRVFGKYQAVSDTFTRLDGTEMPVEFMRELELTDRRGSGDGFVGAEIPYVGGEFSMLVIVPDPGRFEEIRDRLDQAMLDHIDNSFTTGPYELLIPKWDTTTNLDLKPWLTDLGAAPGSYPAIDPKAWLEDAVHGADIAVDERGTVAAAVTGVTFITSGPPEPELTVKADRPFLYLIRHRPNGAVLFAGQVTDPTT